LTDVIESPPERRKSVKEQNVLMILLAVLIVFVVTGSVAIYSKVEQRPISILVTQTPTRDEVNEAAARLILAGRASELYDFYAYEVGDPMKAALYVQAAMEGDGVHPAPMDLVMAIGWWEGGHSLNRVDGPNANGSFDVRPMGLNTITYKKYSLADLQRVEVNIPFGVSHLVGDKERWRISWEAALASYNKGSPKGLDQSQIDYVVAILRHEWEIDRRFAARFPEMF
jgi:hypothetical protein